MKFKPVIKILKYMSFGLIVFLIFTLLIPFLNFSCTSRKLAKVEKKVLVIGHRGAAGLCPENTLSAFQKGIDNKVDYVELDVHLSKDDSIIVMHDNTVNRTTNGKGKIQELTYQEIRQLDAGSWFDEKFKGEKVPTISEVLKLVNGQCKVLIEIKWPSHGIYNGLVKKLVAEIRACHAESWIVLQSFEKKYLEEIHEQAPDLEIQELVFGKVNIPPVCFRRSISFGRFQSLPYSKSVNIFYIYLNRDFINEQNQLGKTVFAFGINSKNNMVRAINLGVDGIITDYPDKARLLLPRN